MQVFGDSPRIPQDFSFLVFGVIILIIELFFLSKGPRGPPGEAGPQGPQVSNKYFFS